MQTAFPAYLSILTIFVKQGSQTIYFYRGEYLAQFPFLLHPKFRGFHGKIHNFSKYQVRGPKLGQYVGII